MVCCLLLWQWWLQLPGSCWVVLALLTVPQPPPDTQRRGRNCRVSPASAAWWSPACSWAYWTSQRRKTPGPPSLRYFEDCGELGAVGCLLVTYFCHVSFGNQLEPFSSFALCSVRPVRSLSPTDTSLLTYPSAYCQPPVMLRRFESGRCVITACSGFLLLCSSEDPGSLTQPAVGHEGSPTPIIPALPRSFTTLSVPSSSSCLAGCHEEKVFNMD